MRLVRMIPNMAGRGGGIFTAGPNNPSTAVQASDAGNAWSNYSNVYSSNNSYCNVTLPDANGSHYIKATNFGFSLPSDAVIFGIIAEVECYASGDNVITRNVKIVKGGSIVGATQSSQTIPQIESYLSFGGIEDLWGQTWLYSDINSSNFGLAFSASNDEAGANRNVFVDHIRVSVRYSSFS